MAQDGRQARWDKHNQQRRQSILDASLQVIEAQPPGIFDRSAMQSLESIPILPSLSTLTDEPMRPYLLRSQLERINPSMAMVSCL